MSKGKDSFPIDAAQVVGLFMESVFYGIFLVSFFACMRALLWSGTWFKPFHMWNKKMLTASLLMFTVASLDVAFHLRHNLEAFIWFDGDPIEDFDRTSAWLNVIAMGCYVVQTFIGDAILIFRCWIVYNKRWDIIAFPVLFWVGTTVCGTITIYVEATINTSGKLLNASTLVPFITSMLCLTLATNVLTTCAYQLTVTRVYTTFSNAAPALIVYRIWTIRKGLTHRSAVILSQSPLTSIAIVLVESGLLYTMSIVILFALYLASNNGQYGVSNAVVQIIGITFNLIITSVDRRESGLESEASHRHHERNQPLHMISIKTTVSRFPDPAAGRSRSPVRGTTPESVDTKATGIANKWEEGGK
ncbi:hypothetical protein HYPSUDRAFT_172188 [Hypholoma sublateritium FD-334 SS-4]|uniref:Uncharacterized protein n=1 Tax=Hypholoma sublateritium (strain FD-334 SS-4) TaxID=945553 RepID=A0A0D2NGQ0_HYPSF|nr:hypothetical protein HYPSUDRAFT_172188 [Hypholoma sublateritium FD-334 SS-4]